VHKANGKYFVILIGNTNMIMMSSSSSSNSYTKNNNNNNPKHVTYLAYVYAYAKFQKPTCLIGVEQ
jgi:hypothetical protein